MIVILLFLILVTLIFGTTAALITGAVLAVLFVVGLLLDY